jgi:hypothetical protein
MQPDRTHHLLTYLTLALAGICLTCAEVIYLPEMVLVLPVYLGLVALAWRRRRQKSMPAWLANVLAIVIAGSAMLWIMVRSNDADESWSHDVPLAVRLIPHLGAVLMAVLVVRLFRPATAVDFWTFQGLGLLQVALGCVLASGMLFAMSFFAYLFVAGCAIAFHERHLQGRPGQGMVEEDRPQTPNGHSSMPPSGAHAPRHAGWLSFGFRWTPAVFVIVGVLYVLTPRIEGPEWDPLARFGVNPPKIRMQTGFSDEMDLWRTGRIRNDTSAAFTFRIENREGRPVRGIQENQRFRGLIFDQYNDGKWRVSAELKGFKQAPPLGASTLVVERSDVVFLHFRVPQEAGGLFLAEPVLSGPHPSKLPIASDEADSKRPLPFFEVPGTGTVVGNSFLLEPESRYVQSFVLGTSRERYPAVRISNNNTYLQKLISIRKLELLPWSIERVKQMDRQQFPEAERLLPYLEQLRSPGAFLPPMYFEPVARLFADYLSHGGEFTWSAEVRRQDQRIDPVVDFLLHVKQGPCERFASALALLLRAQGIPARIVRGFRGAEYEGEGRYVVYNHYAHAWVEALVASQTGTGYDWLILDPTPPEALPSTTALVRLQRSSQALWRDLILGYAADEQFDLWDDLVSGRLLGSLAPWLGLAALLAALGWVIRRSWRRAVSRGKQSTLYDRMLALLAGRIELRPEPAETPVELADRASAVLAERPATAALADVPVEVVTLYYSMRYGGQTPDGTVLYEVAGRLDALERALRGG